MAPAPKNDCLAPSPPLAEALPGRIARPAAASAPASTARRVAGASPAARIAIVALAHTAGAATRVPVMLLVPTAPVGKTKAMMLASGSGKERGRSRWAPVDRRVKGTSRREGATAVNALTDRRANGGTKDGARGRVQQRKQHRQEQYNQRRTRQSSEPWSPWGTPSRHSGARPGQRLSAARRAHAAARTRPPSSYHIPRGRGGREGSEGERGDGCKMVVCVWMAAGNGRGVAAKEGGGAAECGRQLSGAARRRSALRAPRSPVSAGVTSMGARNDHPKRKRKTQLKRCCGAHPPPSRTP